jgi:hypothetical protein
MRPTVHHRHVAVLLLLAVLFGGTTKADMVVTLGDSYSSGTGIYPLFGYDVFFGAKETLDGSDRHYRFTVTTPATCLRELDTTPGARYAKHQQQTDFEMVACAGAEISNLYDQIDYMNDKFPEQAAKSWANSTFVLTIGLNNLKTVDDQNIWFNVVLGCALFQDDCSQDVNNQVGNRDKVATELTAALSYLAGVANQATIRVFGYGNSTTWK